MQKIIKMFQSTIGQDYFAPRSDKEKVRKKKMNSVNFCQSIEGGVWSDRTLIQIFGKKKKNAVEQNFKDAEPVEGCTYFNMSEKSYDVYQTVALILGPMFT